MSEARYRIAFARSAAKEFRALPLDIKRRIEQAVDRLESNARPPGAQKLAGHDRTFRIRVGHYRVIYEIDDEQQLIHVTRVRHRRDVYR